MGYGYGPGKRRHGSRRARRAAGIAAAVGGALWFLLGYAAFEQIKPIARLPLLAQIGAFLGIGLAVIVVLWVVVRVIAPVFYRQRPSRLDVDGALDKARFRPAEGGADGGTPAEAAAGDAAGQEHSAARRDAGA